PRRPSPKKPAERAEREEREIAKRGDAMNGQVAERRNRAALCGCCRHGFFRALECGDYRRFHPCVAPRLSSPQRRDPRRLDVSAKAALNRRTPNHPRYYRKNVTKIEWRKAGSASNMT